MFVSLFMLIVSFSIYYFCVLCLCSFVSVLLGELGLLLVALRLLLLLDARDDPMT